MARNQADVVVGWAALTAVSGRCVYAGVAEVSVYVAASRTRSRGGKQLLQALVTASEAEGSGHYKQAFLPKMKASVTLHERCGFRVVGRREKVGAAKRPLAGCSAAGAAQSNCGAAMIVILMGVSGSGKSTVGEALAQAWQRPFFDGADFHPAENVTKMAAGLPLTDADRAPWLAALRQLIDRRLTDGQDAILATSALKATYRQTLGSKRPDVLLVYLRGSYEQILTRMAQRDHFMPPALLQSQFDTLEEPTDALVIDIDQPVAATVLHILAVLNRMDYDAAV